MGKERGVETTKLRSSSEISQRKKTFQPYKSILDPGKKFLGAESYLTSQGKNQKDARQGFEENSQAGTAAGSGTIFP